MLLIVNALSISESKGSQKLIVSMTTLFNFNAEYGKFQTSLLTKIFMKIIVGRLTSKITS
jgi:hypothetical protein